MVRAFVITSRLNLQLYLRYDPGILWYPLPVGITYKKVFQDILKRMVDQIKDRVLIMVYRVKVSEVTCVACQFYRV